MTARGAARVAWSLWAATVLLVASGLALAYGAEGPMYEYWRESSLIAVGYATVGALIVTRRPANVIGRILCIGGVCAGTQMVSGQYATTSLLGGDAELPRGALAAWLSGVMQIAAVVSFLLLLLLFPDGRLPSPRWRPAGWAAGASVAVAITGTALQPGPVESLPFADNPFGLESVGPVIRALQVLAPVGSLAIPVLAVSSLAIRFRRSRGVERQQVKWLLYAASSGIVVLAVSDLLSEALGSFVWTVVPLSIPTAIGIAILRYRLYDIDRIINRTLVYALLTALLAACYVAIVASVSSVAGESDLTIAGATLAVAALFQPLRRRVQGFIDRRFYRSRYDAARTVESFSARLRDEVTLDAVRVDLLGVVRDTLQPAHASLWLRSQEAPR